MELVQSGEAMVTDRILPNLPILEESQQTTVHTKLKESNLCLLD